MIVTLSFDEWFHAVQVGLLRQHHSLHRGNKDSLYDKPWMDQLDIHILGACGEVAAAKSLGIFWSGHVNQYKSVADLLPNYEVRHRTKQTYDLIVRKDDSKDRIYILTCADKKDIPNVEIVGWISGEEAAKDEWVQTHGGWKPAYFVPRSALHPMETINGKLIGKDVE